MDNEMKKFKERKDQLEIELKNVKEEIKKNKINHNQLEIELKDVKEEIKKNKINHNQDFGNTLIRVNNKFDEAIDNINEKREASGFDKLSKPKTTELVVRHKEWVQIENDIIHFNVELEENRGITNVI